MKKSLALLVYFILVVLLIFALCGCGDKDEPAADSALAEQESAMSTAFANAELLYSWFTGCNHISVDENDTLTVGTDIYQRVTQTGYSTSDELRTALSKYFTEDIVNKLMNTKVYGDCKLFEDFDGALYTYSDYIGLVRWDIGERTASITESTDTSVVYHVDIVYSYYNSDFAAQFDYKYVLCEDGQWRFASFELPAELVGEEMFGMNSDDTAN